MSLECNFIDMNVLEATVHSRTKISVGDKMRHTLLQIPLVGDIGKYVYNKMDSRNGSNDHQKIKRMWPESKIKNFNPEPLNLEPGDVVQVRPKEEIFATLNEDGKYKGLLFMREMVKFCDKEFTVFKKVKKIQLESTLEMRELKSPTVFLEGVFCDGEFHDQCDRSCFLYWKEAWLKKVK